MVAKGGEQRDFLVTFMPFVHEGEEGIMGWLLDITERKRMEEYRPWFREAKRPPR